MTRALPVKLTAFFLVLTLLAGCQSTVVSTTVDTATPSPSATTAPLTDFTLPCGPGDIHPILNESDVNRTFLPLVWEGLFALDNTFAPQPSLCQEYTHSDDYLVWTFSLGTDAYFSDGEPLTAQDVVYSLNLARNDGQYVARLSALTNVSASDETTVSITLSQPNSSLPALLDVPILSATTGLGTGCYALDGLQLVADGTQPDGMPATIELHPIDSADQIFPAFLNQTLSLVSADISSALSSTALTFWSAPTTTMLYLGFQCQDGVCSDSNLRQVLQSLIPRDDIVNVIYKRCGTVATLPISPCSGLYPQDLSQSLTLSHTVLAETMTAAGYAQNEDGLWLSGYTPLSLTLLVNADNSNRVSAAQAIATQWEDFGIAVTVSALPWADYLTALNTGDFDLYLAETTLTADFDLSALLTGSLNFGGYDSPEVQNLLTALEASDDTQRTDATLALMAVVAEDMPIAAISFQSLAVFAQDGLLSDLTPTRQNPLEGLVLATE